jgi:hypothetical protein
MIPVLRSLGALPLKANSKPDGRVFLEPGNARPESSAVYFLLSSQPEKEMAVIRESHGRKLGALDLYRILSELEICVRRQMQKSSALAKAILRRVSHD